MNGSSTTNDSLNETANDQLPGGDGVVQLVNDLPHSSFAHIDKLSARVVNNVALPCPRESQTNAHNVRMMLVGTIDNHLIR